MAQAVAAHDIPFKENQRPPTIHVQVALLHKPISKGLFHNIIFK